MLCTVTQWPGLCGTGDSEHQLLQEAVALGDKVKLLAVFKTAEIQATYLLSKLLLINLTVFHL